MPQYRKKPVVIEAIQFDGNEGNALSIMVTFDTTNVTYDREDRVLLIDTLEGRMTANAGDWIIQGVAGELYPCKPDIFAALYDEVAE